MTYQEPKLKITRSFSRKINTGNYENIDIMASYTEAVFEDEYTGAQVQNLSDRLYRQARADVENAVVEFGNERVKKTDRKLEQGEEANLNLGLEVEEEADNKEKLLTEANNAFGTK